MRAKATYVYCAVQARRKPSFRHLPAGPPGVGAHRLLDAGRDLWLVVADAPLSRYGEEPIRQGLHDMKWLSRCAVGHEAVVEYCLRARAVVPMKLFTIFENDFRATSEIERRRAEIDASLKRVAGRREWGVRIRATPAVLRAPRGRRTNKPTSTARTGASYLAAKKQVRDDTREMAIRAQARVNRAYSALAALSADARRLPPAIGGEQSTRLLLDAAFLVPRAGTSRFRAATRRAARSLSRDGYGVEITGPWPPYNFIEP
jgi:hypothetical protein